MFVFVSRFPSDAINYNLRSSPEIAKLQLKLAFRSLLYKQEIDLADRNFVKKK